MFSARSKLSGICIGNTRNMAGIFNDGNLHAETYSKVWNMMFAGILRSDDHSLYPAMAEAAGHNDSVKAG